MTFLKFSLINNFLIGLFAHSDFSTMACQNIFHETMTLTFYDNLLWVGLVHRSIHTYSHPECPQIPVVLDSSQYGGQSCGHQIRGPEGHNGADMLNSNAVIW